jgi:tetratricopeptide (TPR) repeat protein
MVSAGKLSKSFDQLLVVSQSYDRVPTHASGKGHIVRIVEALGATAVPLLIRKLRSGSEEEAAWSQYLLSRAGSDRAIASLRALSTDAAVGATRRTAALALLAELGAPVRAALRSVDTAELPDDTAQAMVDEIAERADAARVADRLVSQVDPVDLVPVLRRLAAARGAQIAPLLEEVVLRDDLWTGAARQLGELRARIGPAIELPAPAGRIYAGAGPAGAAILAVRRGSSGRRRRALLVFLATDGALVRVLYDDSGAPGFALGALRGRLAADGYVMRRSSVRTVAARVAWAARRARDAGDRLPRGYFLGRDLVGLFDEHMAPAPPSGAAQLLERGCELLESGDAAAARPLLAAFASVHPEDAEARTWIACALVALGEKDAALLHLRAAARLEPEDPVRHWNVASAARQAERHGLSYLALGEFLRRSRGKRTPARRRAAQRYRKLYEQMMAQEHPDARPRDIARAEELFQRACDHLDGGRPADAARGFEAVVRLIPSHHPSWSNLGAAYAQQGRSAEARRCLERALAHRPGYDVAERNLRALERPTSPS